MKKINQTIGEIPALPTAPSLDRIASFDDEAMAFVEGQVALERALQRRIPELNKFAEEANAVAEEVNSKIGEIRGELIDKKREIEEGFADTKRGIALQIKTAKADISAERIEIASEISAAKTELEATKIAISNIKATIGAGKINDSITTTTDTWSSQKISDAISKIQPASPQNFDVLENIIIQNSTLNAPILNNATLNGTTTLATATLSAPTLTDPKISLGEAGVGKAGQVLMSQGEGKAPKWKRITNDFLYLPEVGEEAEEGRARVIGVNEGNIITINPQDYTESIRLPDIATLEVGKQYSISNMGQYPITIYFAPNKILGSVAAEATELLVVAEERGRKFWQHNLHGFAYTKMFATAKVGSEYMHKIDNDRYFILSNQSNAPVKYFDFRRNAKFEIVIQGVALYDFKPQKINDDIYVIPSVHNNLLTAYFIDINQGRVSELHNINFSYQIKAVAKVDDYLLFFKTGEAYTPHYLIAELNLTSKKFRSMSENDYFVDMYSGKLYFHNGSYFHLVGGWNGTKQKLNTINTYSGHTPRRDRLSFVVNMVDFKSLDTEIFVGKKRASISDHAQRALHYNSTGALHSARGGGIVAGNSYEKFDREDNLYVNKVSEADFVLFTLRGKNKIFRGGSVLDIDNCNFFLSDDTKMVFTKQKMDFATRTNKTKNLVMNFNYFSNNSEVVFKQKVITRFNDKILLAQIADEQP